MNEKNLEYLDFEQSIAELDDKIRELNRLGDESGIEVSEQIQKLQAQNKRQTQSIFKGLSDWQVAMLARHPLRPHTVDYLESMFTDFIELHGDRHYHDDRAIIGGLAKIQGRTVMIIGHEKGRKTFEKIHHNFGMPKPEGYRKALRLMKLSEQFGIPIISLIDTPGAYPGVGAEERGQSEAIAVNLREMSEIRVPIVCVVIGEGGSGGALGIGVGDHIMMLEYSIYSVISPEGCASILWKDAAKASLAAEALALTAKKLLDQGIIDEIVPEPLGGAHRSLETTVLNLQSSLIRSLDEISALSTDTMLEKRYQKLMAYGRFSE